MPHSIGPFYDLDTPVGQHCVNSALDVMLVQYFLFHIWFDDANGWGMPKHFTTLTAPPDSRAVFPHDGQFRPSLVGWIKAFQHDANAKGLGPLFVDGVVSRADMAWGRRNSPKKWYTITVLNHLFFIADRDRFWELGTDPSLPSPLRDRLRSGRFDCC